MISLYDLHSSLNSLVPNSTYWLITVLCSKHRSLPTGNSQLWPFLGGPYLNSSLLTIQGINSGTNGLILLTWLNTEASDVQIMK
jgi:hypothetical protein